MEKVLIPVCFIGGFLVGRNWKKIAALSGPYVKKGIKQTETVVSKSFKAASNGFKAASSYLGSQRSKPFLVKSGNGKSKRRNKMSKPAVAMAVA